MDRLDELALLVAVIDAGSLTKAARRLRRSPPAVTRALAALEARVGEQLVARSTRRLAPTELGLAVAARARALLAEYDAMTGEASVAALQGLIKIAAPVQFGGRHVAPIVDAFLDAHPAMRAELVLNDRNVDLREEAIDVAVRIGPLADSTLVARRVGTVRRVLVASPAYLAARGMPRMPADLAEHDTILGTSLRGMPEWRFSEGARSSAVRLRPRLMVNDIDTQRRAARDGRGIARLLSYQVVEELQTGTLVRLLPSFEAAPLPVQLITRGEAHVPPRTRAFLDLAWQHLKALHAIQAEAVSPEAPAACPPHKVVPGRT